MKQRLIIGTVALGAAVLVAGCSDRQATASSMRTPAAPVAGSSDRGGRAGGAVSSDRLVKEIRHELVMLPYYGVFDNLSYRIDGGTVTLFGQVTRPTLKSDAENVVKGLEGVDRVVNNIEVLPPSPNDDQIRLAAYRTIYGFPSLNRYALAAVPSIHIIVNNGRITLTGVVANEGDKNAANIQANSVPGVFGVTNELQIENR